MLRVTKKEIYAHYGIDFDGKYIIAPDFGPILPLLKNNNRKVGKKVYTSSTLAGTKEYALTICERGYIVTGTCVCDCKGCYAKTGCYNFPGVKISNAISTILARDYLEFYRRAIIAQIHADKIKYCRVHASGDFFSADYINAWRSIVKACPDCIFWTYTKNPAAENAFDDLNNINIVKSCIAGIGYNYGEISHVINAYNALKNAGENAYICRCGIDENQHCENCTGCSKNKYVLFIEHSTDYVAKLDPRYDEIAALINSQPAQK